MRRGKQLVVLTRFTLLDHKDGTFSTLVKITAVPQHLCDNINSTFLGQDIRFIADISTLHVKQHT